MRRIVGGIKEMATFWTSIGVMLFPLGLAVLIQWPNRVFVAFGLIIVGGILGIVGLGFTIRDERRANEKENEEREQREQKDLNNQREHDELIALLVGTTRKLSTPRTLRLIERIREIRSDEDK